MIYPLLIYILFYSARVSPFTSPFSDLWTVSKTFSSGGFEGEVKVPVLSSTTSGWRLALIFDKPVKGLKIWRGKVNDVSPDFTHYEIVNQPWNTYLNKGSKFNFQILGHSVGGLPSLKVDFQGKVFGEEEESSSSGQESGSGSELWVDYDQVLKLSLEFFEAKRSGKLSSDNRIQWKSDSALYDGGVEGRDLTGGYYVGGDYVKFGYPMAFAMTQLAWGALEARSGYENAGESINLLKALKWGTDYFLKAHASENELYGMVGDPGIDHSQWEGGHNIKWRRPAFKLTKEDPGSDLAAETAAALASISILLSDIEPPYAEHLRNEAQYLYNFADTYRARYDAFSIPGAKDYYPSTEYGDELVWASIWLYKATGGQEYLDGAISKYEEFRLSTQSVKTGFNYDNKILGIQISLAEITGEHEKYMVTVLEFCDKWSDRFAPVTADGLLMMSRAKSAISFSANTAFICAIAAKQTKDERQANSFKSMADNLIAEILGKGSKMGFMVGFGERYPVSLHDRESSCPPRPHPCGWDFFNSPTPNANLLIGAVVGGPDKKGRFEDSRKNFVGNQPNLLYNSAFQSAVAIMSSYHIEADGRSYTPSAIDDIRASLFHGENQPAFDSCASEPCENGGICSRDGEFSYNCECPPDVHGRNCDFRLNPSIKWVNRWGSGAEIQIVLPNRLPPEPWQLGIEFPKSCPLQEIDVWNVCINVPESNRNEGNILMQRVGWHKSMNFIGLKFEMGQSKLDHCFLDESYRFTFVQRESSLLAQKNPDKCPRKLPHSYGGSGSGFSGDYADNTDFQNFNSGPLTPAPGSTAPPPTHAPDLIQGDVSIGPPEMLKWISKWMFGGQGHIHVDQLRPNEKGKWYLTVTVPPGCPIQSIRFWGACTVRNLNNPLQGEYVLEQIDWQIHQNFIGFAAHFYRGAGDADVCYDNQLFQFKFTVNRISFNDDVNSCPADFNDLPLPNNVNKGATPLRDSPVLSDSPLVDPAQLGQLLLEPIPSVERLTAEEAQDSSVKISWNAFSSEAAEEIEIIIEPFKPENIEFDDEFVTAYRKQFIVSTVESSITVNDLISGMKYQVSAKAIGRDDQFSPMTSLYFTRKPSDVQDIHSSSLDDSTVHVTWKQPTGVHEEYRIVYVPDSKNGQPQSPFLVPSHLTEATITGLTTGSNYLITILTLSGGSISDGVHIHAQTVSNRCSELTCRQNEICENEISGPKCVCMGGFEGPNCSDVDECAKETVNCHENATCLNSVGSFTCVCNVGFTGDGFFCYDLNECSLKTPLCSGSCVNSIGSYFCACPKGYTGDLDNCVDYDECSNNAYDCPDHLMCSNNIGSYSCVCESGFKVMDSQCTDIDECNEVTHSCSSLMRCVNTVGNYKCLCVKGYELVENTCVDVDECTSSHDSCHDNSICRNVIGGYECDCAKGYQQVDFSCQDFDECAAANICSVNAICQNTDGSYSCACLSGYTGDGINCRELVELGRNVIDECILGTHECDIHAVCRNTQDSYLCECESGYSGNGTFCSDLNECTHDLNSNPCSVFPNTHCVNTNGGYKCECVEGWRSSFGGCLDVDECVEQLAPCNKNAVCSNVEGSYTCSCVVGFTGDGKTCNPK